MPDSKWARGIILAAAGLWVVVAFFMGVPVDRTWLKYVGIIASVVVWGTITFDLFVWRWLPRWLVKRPNLRGTWRGTLASTWTGDGSPQQPREFYLVIRQTYSRIHIESFFDISDSCSTSADIVLGDGSPVLWYTYDSNAHALHTDNNPPHRGAVRLSVQTEPHLSMAGDYWTGRKTTGRMELSARSPKLVGSFAGAKGLKYA
jgi:hypothetical protein